MKAITKKLKGNKAFTLFIMLVVVLGVFTAMRSYYFTISNFKTILYNASIPGILMIGFTTLMLSGNADMSVASVGTISAVFCSFLINLGVPWLLAAVICIIFGGLCGAFNALTWYRFHIIPFIGTMGISYIWTGLAGFITKNAAIVIDVPTFQAFTGTYIGFLPVAFIYCIILAIIYGVMLSKTKLGRRVYMCGGNPMAARLSGVNVSKIGTTMMVNCSMVSAFGGVVMLGRMQQIRSDSMSSTLMSSITAAFLGGISFGGGSGTMLGAFIGLLVINSFNNGLIMIGMDTYWQIFSQGALLVFALLVDRMNTAPTSQFKKMKKEYEKTHAEAK